MTSDFQALDQGDRIEITDPMLRKQSAAALPKHSPDHVGFGSAVPTDRDSATEASKASKHRKLPAFALHTQVDERGRRNYNG
jgi:hypothetical protein